ncbi:MAG: bifunctional diaminohydroxyphosphoribosylaminopyrimidine deaminase/5-amino-6-(5-phosphoribosylamino)uracil reductase RibD [Planctomycetota bacterium]
MPDPAASQDDHRLMARAVELAKRGVGRVEPNPMVGCVLAREGRIVGEGWHQEFGGPHAEVHALRAAGDQSRGATAYVSLEPCCHTGKTPPCSRTLIDAGVARVVVAVRDPFPKVDGGGLAELERAGIEVIVGPGEAAARAVLAPYLKLMTNGRPWVIAKWAMTLDGKIATRTGDSQWISGDKSRRAVHTLRGRVDAVIVGRGTALADDPLLTARPPGPRTPTRIVLGSPQPGCRLIETAAEAPVLLVAASTHEQQQLAWASDAGAEVLLIEGESQAERITRTLEELGRRRMTNVLVEGGAGVLGAMLDARQIDEAQVFIGPKLFGGEGAPSPVAGVGAERLRDALVAARIEVAESGSDAYLRAFFGD